MSRRLFSTRRPNERRETAERSSRFGWLTKQRLRIAALACLGLAALATLGVLILVIVAASTLPPLEELNKRMIAQSTKIYDRTGTHLLYETYGDQKRTVIPLDKISPYATKATIAIEDKYFYQHHGIRIQSIVRSQISNVLGLKTGAGGASTLTQQLVKNAIVGNVRGGLPGVMRKIREWILALKLEKRYTKDQILTMYLNEISYGSTNYGIEAAAHSYFNKNAADLTLPEGAALAAMLPQPSYYLKNPDALKARRNTVLRLMNEQGYITKEERASAEKADLVFDRAKGILNAPHFVVRVTNELNDQFGERVVDTSGFKVITTLDFDKQLMAEKIVKEQGDKFAKDANANNAALVSLDPKTGQILALVGSRDFYNKDINGQFDVISQGRRQPGSSLKPLVYLAAFERGFTPETVLYDVRTDFDLRAGVNGSVHNANNKEYGLITMRSALQGSLNIPAEKTMYLVGIKETHDFLSRFGYSAFQDDLGLSLVLGGGVVNPLEHTAAYATLANDGAYNKPVSILKIENEKGESLYQWQPADPVQAVSKDLAATITNVLSDNNARAYIFGTKNNLVLPNNRPSAAKTGTTQNYWDAWTLGYTPSLTTGVWVGNSDNSPMKSGQGGEKLAGLIWNQFMAQAVSGTPIEKFDPLPSSTPPDKPVLRGANGGIKLKINSLTGKLASSSTPPQLIVEQTYLPPHDILYYVNRLDPRGPAPTNPSDDPQFQNWENALQNWVTRQNATTTRVVLSDPPTETDSFDPALAPTLEVLSPLPNNIYTSRLLEFTVKANAPRGISRVEYRIDGLVVGTSRTSPFNLSYYAQTLSKGQHTLTVIALDDQGNQAQQEIAFSLDVELDPPSASWFGGNSVTLSNTDFPRAIYLTPFRLSDMKNIEIYLTTPNGEKKLIYTFTPKDELFNGNLIFTWNHSPGVGDSTLSAVVNDSAGATRSADLRVTVR